MEYINMSVEVLLTAAALKRGLEEGRRLVGYYNPAWHYSLCCLENNECSFLIDFKFYKVGRYVSYKVSHQWTQKRANTYLIKSQSGESLCSAISAEAAALAMSEMAKQEIMGK